MIVLRRMFVVTVVNAWCGFSIHAWILVCRFLCMPLLERMFVTMERRGTSCFQSKSCLDSGMPLWERMHVSGLCGRGFRCMCSFVRSGHPSLRTFITSTYPIVYVCNFEQMVFPVLVFLSRTAMAHACQVGHLWVWLRQVFGWSLPPCPWWFVLATHVKQHSGNGPCVARL